VTRHANRGIVLELDAASGVTYDENAIHYRDGTNVAQAWNVRAAEAEFEKLFDGEGFHWRTLDPPPVTEVAVRVTVEP
jgi:hypothetical protein